jgi:DNA-binding response OmpR family regulator
MKKVLLICESDDVLEAKRVVLEGAGYEVHPLARNERARAAAETLGASLIIIDVTSGAEEARAALEELSTPDAPSSIPVLVIGDATAFAEFEGPGQAIRKPAQKRALLKSTRTLIQGQPKVWAKKRG